MTEESITNDYIIRQIHHDEYGIISKLNHAAFEYNERGGDSYRHEIFADNIRRSPYYIPELDLIIITNDGANYLGHAVFTSIPMGDNGKHIIWLNCLAVKYSEKDDQIEKSFECQSIGIGTALVMRGFEIAKSLGFTGCMTCGRSDVYRKKMGFFDYRSFGIVWDGCVDEPDDAIHAIELAPGGFDNTSKRLSFSYYDFFRNETLIQVLCKMLGTNIINADYQSKRLHGGTVGEVRLVSGIAVTSDDDKLPYKIVLKIQKKWERQGDPNSWRREYDLYTSDFGNLFTESFRWPDCYYAAINREETETQLWLEYIDGISGNDLTADMLEKAAEGIGRFHGRLYRQPEILNSINFFSISKGQKYYYLSCRERVAGYIRSDDCSIPNHLRKLLIDIAENAEKIFVEIEKFPTVLSHRDFWLENIFYTDGAIRLIDWDSTGWGYMIEDITQLIIDDTKAENIEEYYRRLVPAYIRGLSEYFDTTAFGNLYVWELMIIKFTGYSLIYKYILTESEEIKAQQIAVLQKIYEMKYSM